MPYKKHPDQSNNKLQPDVEPRYIIVGKQTQNLNDKSEFCKQKTSKKYLKAHN